MNKDEWIDLYLKWLRSQYRLTSLPLGTEFITPFTNSIGDNIRIYLQEQNDKKIRLSDDGNTFADLDLMGIDLTNQTRQALATHVFKQYGTEVSEDDVIFIEGQPAQFPLLKQHLLQTILRVGDLTQTRKSVVQNILQQDVAIYFAENEIAAVPKYNLKGSTGNSYRFDFAIGATKSKPLRLVQTIPTLTFERVAAESITYADIKNGAPTAKISYTIIFDDANSSIPAKAKNIAEQYGAVLIPWSDKRQLSELVLCSD